MNPSLRSRMTTEGVTYLASFSHPQGPCHPERSAEGGEADGGGNRFVDEGVERRRADGVEHDLALRR